MGFFRRNRGPAVDSGLPDDQWLIASERCYERTIGSYHGSPETMARGGDDAEGRGDVGVALFFYRKSIDMLHTAYGFSEMRSRRPSRDDARISDAFCDIVAAIGRARPGAKLDTSVREVTHRLRSISTTCDQHGLDSSLYRAALTRLGAIAPNVPVDDVFWS